MADAGIGEAMLISAAIGGGVGAASGAASGGGDKIWQNALIGAGLGAVGGGIGAGMGAAEGAAPAITELGAPEVAGGALDTSASAFGSAGSAQVTPGGTFASQFGGYAPGFMPEASALPQAGAVPFGGSLPTGAAPLPGGESFSAMAPTGQAASIPGVTPVQGTFPSSVPASLQQSIPGATVEGPGIQSLGGDGIKSAFQSGVSQTGGADQVAKEVAKNAADKGWWSSLSPIEKAGIVGGGTLGLGALLKSDNKRYGVPPQEEYTGPLSKFKYDPARFTPTYATPNVYEARYADGGIANLAGLSDTMFPQSQQDKTQYATPSQLPTSAQVLAADYDTKTNPYTGTESPIGMASGGISNLGNYSDGGQLLRGPGDGVSDSIPASIGRKQPARLADGEFVVPARAVSELGNGSTEAGAKQLYSMLDRIETKRKKGRGLAYQAKPRNLMPA